MHKLTNEDLHRLRLRIFDNAESLHKEAKVLFENGYFARAFLLAYFCCEELGKIPIVVGVIGRRLRGEAIDWKHVMKRFRGHKEKIDSDDYHQYLFGIEPDPLRNTDLRWLENAMDTAQSHVDKKNQSTYIDFDQSTVLSPLDQITKEDAAIMIERSFSSLRAHWHAECLTNPGCPRG